MKIAFAVSHLMAAIGRASHGLITDAFSWWLSCWANHPKRIATIEGSGGPAQIRILANRIIGDGEGDLGERLRDRLDLEGRKAVDDQDGPWLEEKLFSNTPLC